MKKQAMRDAFWDEIYELVKYDRDIVVVSADLGAPSLDKFRRDFPDNYINVGIAEQNAILVATGLALRGKKPIAYAISQFITLRCFEQIRIYPCGMNLNVTIVGVGAGSSYWESGPTHSCVEQISIMRTLPNLQVINCSSQRMAADAAKYCVNQPGPKYIQFDRDAVFGIQDEVTDFSKGYQILRGIEKINIVATGIMTSIALDVQNTLKEENLSVGVIDIFSFPVNEQSLTNDLGSSLKIITLEENTLAGGMGSYILETFNDLNINIPIKRMGFDTSEGYSGFYNYGGREAIRGEFGIDKDSLYHSIRDELR